MTHSTLLEDGCPAEHSPASNPNCVMRPAPYLIRTTHIQSLINEGQRLAQIVNLQDSDKNLVVVGDASGTGRRDLVATPGDCLRRAVNVLRHAAAELEDELLQAEGWPQV